MQATRSTIPRPNNRLKRKQYRKKKEFFFHHFVFLAVFYPEAPNHLERSILFLRQKTDLEITKSASNPMTRATIEVHHFFSNTTPQFGSLRPLRKTDLEKNQN